MVLLGPGRPDLRGMGNVLESIGQMSLIRQVLTGCFTGGAVQWRDSLPCATAAARVLPAPYSLEPLPRADLAFFAATRAANGQKQRHTREDPEV